MAGQQSHMSDVERARDSARQYAWDWFQYHAGQRQSVFRFFLIITAVISTGYVGALSKGLHGISPVFAILLIISAFLFWRLDERSVRLVKIAENYLKKEEARLGNVINDEEIQLVLESDKRDFVNRVFRATYSFKQIYRCIFVVIGFLGLLALVGAIAGPAVPLSQAVQLC